MKKNRFSIKLGLIRIIGFIKFYLSLKNKLIVTEKMMWLYKNNKPIKPYAFIRLHNEIKTVDESLKSILPILKGGVIGFNSCTDGTKEYVLEFCKKYPQFIPAEYPYDVIPANDSRYKKDDIDIKNRLDSYYNFVWDKLPKNEWIIKVDGDHIWNLKHIENLCKLLLRKNEVIFLSRLNLHCDNDKCYVIKANPAAEPGDSWILFNGDLISKSPFTFRRFWRNELFRASESFTMPKLNIIYGILSNWHFPIVKKWRENNPEFECIPLKEWLLKSNGGGNLKDRIPKDMIDVNNILKSYYKFNLSGKRMLP